MGTPAAPYLVNATRGGTVQVNKDAPAVANTGATLLSGAAPSDSLTANFAVGDTVTINGTVVTFVAAGAVGNQLNITDDISTLLAKIDSITGTAIPSTISGGAITLHSGTLSDLSVTSSNSSAFAALGFTGTATALRTGGGTVGTGQVIGQDNSTFLNQTIAGGAVTTYDVSGAPVNLQFRWGKVDSVSLGVGHTDTWNMFYQVNPNATGTNVAWQNINTNFTFSPSGQMTRQIASITLTNAATVNGLSIGSPVMVFGSGGITQFADANGNVQVNQIQQDGFPAGLAAVGRRLDQRPHRRQLLERPQHRSRRNRAGQFQRHELPQAHRRRRLRGDRRIRTSAVRQGRRHCRIIARGIQHRHRRRVHQADRHAAGLFGEHQGHHHFQHDGAGSPERPAIVEGRRAKRSKMGSLS